MRTFLIALVLASLATLSTVAAAAADPAETQHLVIRYEDNTALIDFCTGEEVSLSGRAMVLRQNVVNDNRIVEVRLEKYILEGVNASGETVRLTRRFTRRAQGHSVARSTSFSNRPAIP